ncbi:MAG: hypothetical protein KatS3mg130_0700 [Candidatus Sumerlaea sp.]|nr:MAG: hypothetical protein KatS3mg130_0700 [Candidatus Sumerlaea sp.]
MPESPPVLIGVRCNSSPDSQVAEIESMSAKRHLPTLTGRDAPQVRVTYAQTDRMGVAYYANYFVWFEVGRTELLRSLGQSYREWEDVHGVYLPVAECHCEYRHSAQYDDLLRIETSVSALSKASITFRYQVVREADGLILAQGMTRHPFVNREGKVVRIANKLLPQCFS